MHVQNFSPKFYHKKENRCSLNSCTPSSSDSLQSHSIPKLVLLIKEGICSLWEQIFFFKRSPLLHGILGKFPKCVQFYYAFAYCAYCGLRLCKVVYFGTYVIECVIKVDLPA